MMDFLGVQWFWINIYVLTLFQIPLMFWNSICWWYHLEELFNWRYKISTIGVNKDLWLSLSALFGCCWSWPVAFGMDGWECWWSGTHRNQNVGTALLHLNAKFIAKIRRRMTLLTSKQKREASWYWVIHVWFKNNRKWRSIRQYLKKIIAKWPIKTSGKNVAARDYPDYSGARIPSGVRACPANSGEFRWLKYSIYIQKRRIYSTPRKPTRCWYIEDVKSDVLALSRCCLLFHFSGSAIHSICLQNRVCRNSVKKPTYLNI
jgi:hypothetical protein